MIEAGLAELLDFDSRFEHDLCELVASIYTAMVLAKIDAKWPIEERA